MARDLSERGKQRGGGERDSDRCGEHDWHYMSDTYEPNDDGETTTKKDWYQCPNCGESKVETSQLPFVKRYARDGSNPLENWGGQS